MMAIINGEWEESFLGDFMRRLFLTLAKFGLPLLARLQSLKRTLAGIRMVDRGASRGSFSRTCSLLLPDVQVEAGAMGSGGTS